MVLKSIGYRSKPLPGVPFDEKKGVIPSVSGRVTEGSPSEASMVFPNLYVTGWVRRGPSGIIGTNITDAGEVVKTVLQDKAGKYTSIPKGNDDPHGVGEPEIHGYGKAEQKRPIDVIKRILAEKEAKSETKELTNWKGWLQISAKEVQDGKNLGKFREKIVHVPQMVEVAKSSNA